MPEPQDAAPLPQSNPFIEPSTLPFGLPDFAAVRPEHFRPAIAAGLREQRAEWEAVAADEDLPDVANTLEALERSGLLLQRTLHTFFTLVSSLGDVELHTIESEIAPQLAAHEDALWLDRRIYHRLESLASAAPLLDLDDETAWLLQTYLKNFRRAGATLADADQERLRSLNTEISTLTTEFSQRVVRAMTAGAVTVTGPAALAGLDEGTLAQLLRDTGQYSIPLVLPTQQPLLASLDDRDLRARLLDASLERGAGVDADSDTRATLLRIVRRRAERAALLGYRHHAAYVAADGTAATTEAVEALLVRLTAPAVRNARNEAAQLQTMLDADRGKGHELAPSDWQFYAERLRKERFSFDDAVLRPYLELDRVLADGVFYAANRLYGFTFHLRADLAGYADGVRVWEVREADGTALGLFVGDHHARPGKRGGAWMHTLMDQSTLLGTQPVVVNTLNIAPPSPGRPTLLTWDEVRTCFHEFGHALHAFCSAVRYPSLSGTNVPRDFVEYPSQVNEMWLAHRDVVGSFARHHVTGEPLPAELLEKVLSVGAYGQGFATTEYLGAALLDQAWHRVTAAEVPTDPGAVAAFEGAALERAGIGFALVPPRYRSTYFNHVFAGGYDAGYYAYVWSEVLDADTVDWFTTEAAVDGDGGLNRAAGRRFRDTLLSRGYSRDPLVSFRELRGRDARTDPLLVRRGLTG
ncbi:MAG: M3 family metallopeptidase [Georgenia sp.]